MIFVTSNKGKFREYESIFLNYEIRIDLVQLSYPEEQLDSLEDVAGRSSNYLQGVIKENFFIDDSGLFIDSLGGFPGVYSSYVKRTIGNAGILRLMDGIEERSAVFRTCIAYYDGNLHLFNGSVDGHISLEPRGENGFGFDPIFIPVGEERTYAEMPIEEKNMISHRQMAVIEFIRHLKKKEI